VRGTFGPKNFTVTRFTSLNLKKITSRYISGQFTPHHYTSHHFTYLHSTWPTTLERTLAVQLICQGLDHRRVDVWFPVTAGNFLLWPCSEQLWDPSSILFSSAVCFGCYFPKVKSREAQIPLLWSPGNLFLFFNCPQHLYHNHTRLFYRSLMFIGPCIILLVQ